MERFQLVSPFKPAGDQPQAIEELTRGVREGRRDQVLLGVTGSGKSVAHGESVWVYRPTAYGRRVPELVAIGPLVDRILERHASLIQRAGDHEILHLAVAGEDLFVLSLHPRSLTNEIRRVTAVTRHASPGELYVVNTRCGRSVTVTGDHNFWVSNEGRPQLKRTCELASRDYLPLPLDLPESLAEEDLAFLDTQEWLPRTAALSL